MSRTRTRLSKPFTVRCKDRIIAYERATDRFTVSGTTETFYSRAAAAEWVYLQAAAEKEEV